MRVHHGSPAPEQRGPVPGERPADDGDVDEARRLGVAEVGGVEVEVIGDEQQLGQHEVRAHPQVDEAEEQQVVQDEVGADVGSGGHVWSVGRVEVPAVADLEDVKSEPVSGGVQSAEGRGEG